MQTFIHSPRSLFWLALFAAAVIRLALLAHLWHDPEKLIWSDGGQYYQLAENWLDYGVYARDAADLGHLEQVRPPGYPGSFLVFTLTLWRDPRAVALMQLVLSLSFMMGAYIFFDKLRTALDWRNRSTSFSDRAKLVAPVSHDESRTILRNDVGVCRVT